MHSSLERKVVVAGLIKQKGEILLTQKNGAWTLPTGHMDMGRDSGPQEALQREMREELVGLKSLLIVESLGTLIRNRKTAKAKSIEIFSCNSTGRIVRLIEGREEKPVVWIRPAEALNLEIDELARLAIERYLKKYPAKKYPAKKKEGQNGEGQSSNE